MTDEHKKLILDWKLRLNKAQIGHYTSSEQYDAWHKLVGIGSVVLSSVITGILFFDFKILEQTNIKITLLGLSVVSAVASALQTFLLPGEKSERHRQRANKYGALKRRLELFMVTTHTDSDVEKFLSDINKEWDLITDDAPVTPKSVRKKISKVLEEDAQK